MRAYWDHAGEVKDRMVLALQNRCDASGGFRVMGSAEAGRGVMRGIAG